MEPIPINDRIKAMDDAVRDQSDLDVPPWQDVLKGFTTSILLWTGFTSYFLISGTPLSLGHTLSVSIGCALIGVILSYHIISRISE
jgi:hypothetical protein